MKSISRSHLVDSVTHQHSIDIVALNVPGCYLSVR